jgi:hypothetical protein
MRCHHDAFAIRGRYNAPNLAKTFNDQALILPFCSVATRRARDAASRLWSRVSAVWDAIPVSAISLFSGIQPQDPAWHEPSKIEDTVRPVIEGEQRFIDLFTPMPADHFAQAFKTAVSRDIPDVSPDLPPIQYVRAFIELDPARSKAGGLFPTMRELIFQIEIIRATGRLRPLESPERDLVANNLEAIAAIRVLARRMTVWQDYKILQHLV